MLTILTFVRCSLRTLCWAFQLFAILMLLGCGSQSADVVEADDVGPLNKETLQQQIQGLADQKYFPLQIEQIVLRDVQFPFANDDTADVQIQIIGKASDSYYWELTPMTVYGPGFSASRMQNFQNPVPVPEFAELPAIRANPIFTKRPFRMVSKAGEPCQFDCTYRAVRKEDPRAVPKKHNWVADSITIRQTSPAYASANRFRQTFGTWYPEDRNVPSRQKCLNALPDDSIVVDDSTLEKKEALISSSKALTDKVAKMWKDADKRQNELATNLPKILRKSYHWRADLNANTAVDLYIHAGEGTEQSSAKIAIGENRKEYSGRVESRFPIGRTGTKHSGESPTNGYVPPHLEMTRSSPNQPELPGLAKSDSFEIRYAVDGDLEFVCGDVVRKIRPVRD